MPRKLKVYRTPIGFHDAYVAAPSQKAALEAWGADANLFARGVAEEVTDAALVKEPLAKPGEVIKRARGTAEEHLAALPPDPPKRKHPVVGKAKARAPAEKARTPKPPPPRPPRDELDAAETALADAERRYRDAKEGIEARERALARERQQLERDRDEEIERLEGVRRKAGDAYQRAIADWRERQ